MTTHNLTTGDNLHPLESFFGPYYGTHEKPRADDRLAKETYNLPKAYEGKNLFLEEVLDFKIRKEDEFYTSRLLPWKFTDDIHVKWEIFSFNRTLADLIPEQGVPRYVSAQSESHSDNLLRRGLAFIIEHGFYKTERGKRHFNLNLQQITDAVHTTCYFGVIHALLQGQSYYKEWHRKFGFPISRANDIMQTERRRWGIVQKSRNGLYLLDAELRHEMKRENVVPNTWVFPDKMLIYVNMVGDHQLSYSERGPEANSNRESGDSKTTFRGCPVFEAQAFDVDFTGEPVDLMIRERQCGSFHTLKFGEEKYIYDADKDNWQKITYKDYVQKAVNGNMKKPELDAYRKDHAVSTIKKDVYTGEEYGENDITLPKDNDQSGPDLILFRPHQTYRMASAILAKGGDELGNTFHGHHDFLLSDDIIRKVHVGHYTFYSKSVVKRTKNYVIVEDIFSQGYVGGENTVAFNNAKEYLTARSSNTLGKGDAPSIIVVAVPAGTSDNLKNAVDMTGSFHPSIYERLQEDDQSKEHYPLSSSVHGVLDFKSIEPYRVSEMDEFIQRVQRVNTVCFRGCEGVRDDTTKTFKVTQLNQGHWGENVYPGCRKVRDGENSFLKDCNYQVGL